MNKKKALSQLRVLHCRHLCLLYVFYIFFQIINVHITLRSAAVKKAAKEVSSYGYVMKTEEYLANKRNLN